jgi:peptidoglycan/xylan/chitin deacetylase (PgdA/CDA1 family)
MMLELPVQRRYAWSALPKRRDYAWPEGRRLAFYVITNIEFFAFGAGDVALDNSVIGAPPTQRNYAWRDYGNRVGIWRLLELLDELRLPAAHNVNSLVYEHHPEIMSAIRARGDEVVGHGRTNSELVAGKWEHDEAHIIAEATQTIARHEGRPPQGWLNGSGPQTAATIDLLKEAGYRYMMDWPCDDQPVWMQTRTGPILSVPYSFEVNDTIVCIRRQHTARELADMIVDQFDEMIEQCLEQPLVCSVPLHPFVMGQPFRMQPLRAALRHCLAHAQRDRVWVTRPGAIAQHCYELPGGIVP